MRSKILIEALLKNYFSDEEIDRINHFKVEEEKIKYLEKIIDKILEKYANKVKIKENLKENIKNLFIKIMVNPITPASIRFVYLTGERLFYEKISDIFIATLYKDIKYKLSSIFKDENHLFLKKLDFYFLVLMKHYIDFMIKDEISKLKFSDYSKTSIINSLKKARDEHIKFTSSVIRDLIEKGYMKKINPEECSFGKWLYLEGKNILGENFNLIEEMHKDFHNKINALIDIKNNTDSIDFYLAIKDLKLNSLQLINTIDKIISDISAKMMMLDSLTEIPNRTFLNIILEKEMKKAQRYAIDYSVLMLDIDDFKKINDTYGHLVGDIVLRKVAKTIKSTLRESDYIFRYGGEEFLILLPYTDIEKAKIVAEKILNKIWEIKIPSIPNLKITASIGIAKLENCENPWQEIDKADIALYQAKRAGKNKYLIYNI